MKKVIGVVLIILTAHYVFGQKSITNQNLVWYGLFTTLEINKKWYFQNEVQERHFVHPTVQHQFLIRSHIHRVLGKSGCRVQYDDCQVGADFLIIDDRHTLR